MAYSIDYINLICTDLGTTAGHRYEIDGINAICVALGGVGGHRYTIDGLNEICSLQSVATGHKYNIDALNAIATGAFRYEDEAWGYIQVGTSLNSFEKTVTDWQASTEYVHNGGHKEASWVSDGTTGGATFLLPRWAFCSAGYVHKLRLKTGTVTTAAWKLKAFRWNSTTSVWDFIGETSFNPTANAAQDVILANPLKIEMADALGLYVPASNQVHYTNTTVPIQNNYVVSSDVINTNTFSLQTSTSVCIETFGTRSFLSFNGDSIIAGNNVGAGNYWIPFTQSSTEPKTLPGGNPTSEPAYIVKSELVLQDLCYQNAAISGAFWNAIASTQLANALACKPHSLILEGGINEILSATGKTLAQIETDLNTIKAAADIAGVQKIYLSAILPSTNISDVLSEKVRTWNAGYAAWCAANNATFIDCYNAMGQIRVSTGFYDDLKASYSYDGVHLTVSGVAAYGAAIAAAIK